RVLFRSRVAGESKRGAPRIYFSSLTDAPTSCNVTEKDKEKFRKGMVKFGLKGEEVALTKVYKNTLYEFYSDEIIAAEQEDRQPIIHSLRSFRYWIKKLFSSDEIIRRQTSKSDFHRNKRGLNNRATAHTEVPGSCFELDATVLDVHVVSEFNRNHVLGRPTVYCVIDKES